MSEELSSGKALVESGAPPAAPPRRARQRSCFGAGLALLGVVVGVLYVINPGAGFFELVPDNIPLFGNLDEAAATTVLVVGLQYLFGRDRAG